jgi:hypothetical protein
MAGGSGAFQAGNVTPGFLVNILALGGVTTLAVASTGVVYSQSFILRRGCTYGWEVAFTSGGVVAVTVELEQSNQPPETEGSQDDSFVIPVGKATTNGLYPTGVCIAAGVRYITAYSPVATVLGRLKLTGTGSNAASTVLSIARMYEIKNF